MFTTDDPDVIAALQAHPKYAGDYQLIERGKEFTGTDEDPIIIWGDYSEFPYRTLEERKILFMPPGSEPEGDLSLAKVGDILFYDDSFFLIRPENNYSQIAESNWVLGIINNQPAGAKLHLTTPYTTTETTFTIPSGYLGNFPIHSFKYVAGVIIENLGAEIVNNIQVSVSSSSCNTLFSVGTGRNIFFQLPQHDVLPAGNEIYLSIHRAGNTTSIKVTFVLVLQ